MSEDKTDVQHLMHEISRIVDRHIDEYDLCTAEVVGVLHNKAFLLQYEVAKAQDEIEDELDEEDDDNLENSL
jgi:hypothetical protein